MSKRFQMLAVSLLAMAVFAGPSFSAADDVPSVVVIGIDGMDPVMLQRYIDQGIMPHFARLAETGTFMSLETSIPPQSPVAWSNFITGMDSGGHGVFDFIHRDPATYLPKFSTASVTSAGRTINIGDWRIPLSAGKTQLLRKGEAFWHVLEGRDVPYDIFRVPANFPPAESKDRTLSGMGTPDILGSYGTFSFYTNDDLYKEKEISGGQLFIVDTSKGSFTSHLVGPKNSLHKGEPDLTMDFTVDVDPENDAAKFTVGDEEFLLQAGEWGPWTHARFNLLGPMKKLSGICRFHLRSVRPYFELYVTPINIDPAAPALPLSTPDDYVKDLHRRIGDFYTQGMPEDTKALEFGALTDAEFVSQTDNVLGERWRMLDTVLDEYNGGFLFFYVSTVDQSCHALWRNVDPKHPAHDMAQDFAHRFEYLYAQMDSLLGVVEERIPDDATLLVMSDHGFGPYYKKFHLNGWLHKEGYMELIRPEEIGRHPLLSNVFWRRTRAYAAGINGLAINKLGREGKGIVTDAQYDGLLDEITAKLLALTDPDTGEHIVTRVYRSSEIYHGPETPNAPDLVIGYNRGYRGSDESALGTVTKEWLTPNMGTWSGTHLNDHTLVPGILLSNRKVTKSDPRLIDLPVTILALYGIDAPEQMRGKDLFATEGEQNVRR